MARWSFGLRQLFLWTAAIALGLVALRSASATWVAVLLGVAVALLASAILLAVYRAGPQRAYWVGLTTFGWLYLLVLVASWTIAQSAPSPLRADNLPTQKLASRSYHWLYDEAFAKYYATGPSGGYYGPMPGGGYIGSGLSDAGSSMGYDPSAMMMGSGAPMAQGMGGNLGGVPPLPGPPPGPKESDFVNVAHAQWTLLFAAIGGCLAYWLDVTGPGRTEQQASGSS